MRRAVIDEILRSHAGVSAEGTLYRMGEGVYVDLLASAGHEVVTLPKLREVRLLELYVAVVTEKNETYFLEYEHIVGLRVKSAERPGGRAGFSPA